jgi:antitoxin PrlF
MTSKECCRIDAVISVDSKGQVVLPKDLREKAKIKPEDKLAVIGFEREGEVCCIIMLKVDALESTVKNMLGPVFRNAFNVEAK